MRAVVGRNITYTIVLTNNAVEPILGNITISGSAGTALPGCATGTSLAAGATLTCTVAYTVTAADGRNGNTPAITFTATGNLADGVQLMAATKTQAGSPVYDGSSNTLSAESAITGTTATFQEGRCDWLRGDSQHPLLCMCPAAPRQVGLACDAKQLQLRTCMPRKVPQILP